MLRSLHLRGYRSLRDFRLKLGRVTVITGENGVGKSNFYRALSMLQRMAEGRLAESIAQEGGMPSLMWAGDRRTDEPHRVIWEIEHEIFSFSIECGLPRPAITAFKLDPDLKEEVLRFGGAKGRIMAKRKRPMIEVRDAEGRLEALTLPFHPTESMLSEVRDGSRYPALTASRDILLGWRFYHQFRSDPESAMRQPRVGFHSPVLAHDGSNLAATLQTIEEAKPGILDETIEAAFPGTKWRAVDDSGSFQLQIARSGLNRWLNAAELSDGTLRFFCLCAALMSSRPSPLLVLNEPESSLHPALLDPLAGMISRVAPETQVIVVTHSQPLAAAITERCEAKIVELVRYEDETRRRGDDSAKRSWTFDE
ncbi:AAA family ATPase [Luteolibacter sp. GHJ8]|uniref:AAA family ATPase n=1 Tax=Luteolibacter rhizosphaerae TaxID=2989719 RepID=A0ABT3G158_9BACT|nr:AAA family ATPase [Luteolibacter rhizosphaerae]MCW1913229.1 AAA family ATPase [Luteolibacter rhizosphaerae]